MRQRILWFLSLLVLLSAPLVGWRAYQELRRAVVVLEWSTASELDSAGFNVYRSDSAEGPFEQINGGLIAASTDPLTGGEYTYYDREVRPGRVYYYELEEVEFDGGTARFGPKEVKAASNGPVNVILAAALAVVGVYGVAALRPRRAASSGEGG
ncbi:MAG: hypothetical protein L0Z70_14155 [Chloroflexi bacterium]|nr:hypothetical protein [Chloroflexota bacterium]